MRVDIAACYRLVALFGMNDLVYNHISGRVPGEEGHFLINPYGYAYEEVTASSLVKIDFDGKLVLDSGTGYGVNLAGFVIHSAVHKARARRGLRDPHPLARRHGGFGAQVRPAAADAERDVLRRRSATTTTKARRSTWTSSSAWCATSAPTRR